MRDNATVFGVNFADGRIKGYPRDIGRDGEPMQAVRRAGPRQPDYGKNHFVDNDDGTICDLATGLMWSKADSGKGMNWQRCPGLVRASSQLAGHGDWRLPSAKELQSIVDYTRAPDAADASRRGPAIDPIFSMTDGESWFWTGTTHLEGPGGQARRRYTSRLAGPWAQSARPQDERPWRGRPAERPQKRRPHERQVGQRPWSAGG